MNKQEFELVKKALFSVGKEINEDTRMTKNAKSFAVAIILNKLCDIQIEFEQKQAMGEQLENANLISAAPDMYDALWAMIELHQADFGCKGLDEPAIDKACAALAKARGE